MSNLAITAQNVINGLTRGEEVVIALPNGTVIKAVPSRVQGPMGEELIQLDVRSDGKAGAIEGVLRMEPRTFDHCVAKAQSLMPRLAVMQSRLMLRGGGGR